MNIHQTFLSNTPEHYQAPTGLAALQQTVVEIPIEQIVTVENSAGHAFAPGGITSWTWLEERGKEVWGYFNAWWPEEDPGPTNLPHERDAQWFRREHIRKIKDKGWTLPSSVPDRPHPNIHKAAYRKWLVNAILETKAAAIIFDNGTIDNKTDAINDWWFLVYDALRAAGVKVVVNGAWQKDEAMQYVDGFMCELWAGNRPRYKKPDGQWGALTEHEFVEISKRWTAAGKTAVMLVRWRPGESVFSDYDEFCLHYLRLAYDCDAMPSFALHDYHRSGWRGWMEDYQDGNIKKIIMRECDARQQVFLNKDSSLQKVIDAKGGVPVVNEFRLVIGGIEFIVQKSEFTSHQAENYHYAPVSDYNAVLSFSK